MSNTKIDPKYFKNLFFSYRITALFTIVFSLANILVWQLDYTENVLTGYSINPKATMKAITSFSFLLIGFSYLTKNKNIILTFIVSGILIQIAEFIAIYFNMFETIHDRLTSGVGLIMFCLIFSALYFLKIRRNRTVFLTLNSVVYVISSFAVFYYLLDMEELITFYGFETLSWNTSIFFFMNSISLFEYKLVKRIGTLKLSEALTHNYHPYKYYPFFFLIPILLIITVSILTYLGHLTTVQAAFFIILFLSTASFINMFLYSYNFIKFYMDITHKAKQLETKNIALTNLNGQLKALNEKINNKNLYLEDFATITSHNLREPIVALDELNKITNYHSKEASLEHTEIKEMFSTSIERLNQGIGALVQYHNFIKNVDKTNKKTILLSKSIKKTYEHLDELKPKNTHLTVDIKDDILLTKSYINDIFRNLFTNSFKFKKDTEPLKLSISAYKINGSYKILYRDNGIGIDLVKNKLNVFKQAKRFHERSRVSNGYGLYYTKLYVDKLNGDIDVFSAPGAGAAFRIIIKT